MTRELVVYSGRNRPDLTPVYSLFEKLTQTHVSVEKIYHREVGQRVIAERHAPGADLLLTNSQLAVEMIRGAGVLEPYRAPVAQSYPDWLRAQDYAWLSFTAWPRVVMVNRTVLPDPAEYPCYLEELAELRFKNRVACAAIVEMTTVAQFAGLRVVKGDAWMRDFVTRLGANGLRVYPSNLDTREALIQEGLAVAFANSSNVHVFYLEGNPVAEAWLDQGADEIGTHVEAHTVAVLRGCQHPETARDFVDFLLSPEIQSLLARLYGETPVNPKAVHGWVRPLAQIRRVDARLDAIVARMDSTVELLRCAGFEVKA